MIHPKQKWGVIGANGCGKSTLFKLLLRQIQEDAGSINIPSDWRLAHMAQEVGESKITAEDYVLDGDTVFRKIESDIANIDDSNGGELLAKLYSDLEHADGYTARARAQQLLSGLGFKPCDGEKSVNEFSGGWRIRLNLARALMCPSDLLLLDEPTNHLDLDATLWLESWLDQYPGTLIIISHDRDFLDNVIGNIVNFENQKLISYSGNYSKYEIQKAERLQLQALAFEKQKDRISQIEQFVNRFKAKASKAKQAQSRLKELNRMEKIAPAHADSPFNFSFPKPEKLPQVLMTLSEASIGYHKDEQPQAIAKNIELSILGSSRIGLLGHNGAGKTTLIKTLAKEMEILSGELSEGLHLNIGYFAQHQLEYLDVSGTPLLHIQRLSATSTEQEIRNFLGSFGFIGDKALDIVGKFSGGEKARLALAMVAWQRPNLLLLDEPTNHLDLEMRHALTMALQAFEGAVVIVSHDRHLLRSTAETFVLVDDGNVKEFDGDLDDYHRWLSDAKKSVGDEAATNASATTIKQDKKQRRLNAAQLRQKTRPLTNAINKLEKNIESAEKKLSELETQLSENSLYEGSNDALLDLLKEQNDLRDKLAKYELEWLEKNEELENLSKV